MKKLVSVLLASALVCGATGTAQAGLFGGGHKAKAKTPTHGDRIPILLSETGALPDPNLATVPVIIPDPALNPNWSQPGGSASKAMGHLALGADLKPVWHKNVAGNTHRERLAAAPVVADGKLFVIDTRAIVRAYDANSGDILWSADFGVKGGTTLVYGGGVSVEDGIVYATNGLGDVGALRAKDGSLIWKKRPGGPLRGAPSVGYGDIYVTSQDNQLFALKATDGNVEWQVSASLELAGVFGAASAAVAQGTVVEGFSSGELNAYRYENGRTLWGDALSRTSMSTSVAALSDIDANPVIDRGRVFAIGAGGRMVSVDLFTGQRIWEINIAGLATPWVAGEWIFAVTDDGQLHCIARGTGKIRWTLLLPNHIKNKADKAAIRWYGPVLAGGRLILTSSQGAIAEVNPGDGSLKSMGRGSGQMSVGPIVANNMLFTLDEAGHLTAWR
jgi:outer membrane protein assembly factor BamB